jgi:hypothetical protein
MIRVSYYDVLSLSPSATATEVKVRYRKLSLRHHPDHGGSNDTMTQLNEAYRVLSHPLLRREYDKTYVTKRRVVTPSHTAGHSSSFSTNDIRRPKAAQHPRYASDPDNTTETASYTYRTTPQSPVQTKGQSRFWPWFTVSAVIIVGFMSYELFATRQPQPFAPTTTVGAATPSSSTDVSTVTPDTSQPSSATGEQSSNQSPTGVTPSTRAFRHKEMRQQRVTNNAVTSYGNDTTQ